MKLHGTEIAVVAALAGAGCAAVFVGLRHAWRQSAQRQQESERQLAALAATVKSLQARVAALSRVAPPAEEIETISAAVEGAGMADLSEPKPETKAIITAAATAFLGKAARIRSTRLVPAEADPVSPWSQQGRVIVQTSHNLRPRE